MSTRSRDDGFGRCCASKRNDRVAATARKTGYAGQTNSSRPPGCSPWTRPGGKRDSPDDQETIDWRAVCGKTACTVRREGRPKVFPTPIRAPPPGAYGLRRVSRADAEETVITRPLLHTRRGTI